MKVSEIDAAYLRNCLVTAEFEEMPGYQRNKVRDAYLLPDCRRVLISTDRQPAFDRVLASVPFKGQVLNETARYWFDATSDICRNHVLSYPDPNIVIVKNLEMLPIEIVVRAYITGSTNTSLWPMYARGDRQIYGYDFPEGIRKNQQLPEPIVTPTTKPLSGGHDAPTTAAEILDSKAVSEEQWNELVEKSLALFARGQELAAERGLILVDTKYEFGVDSDNAIVIADEIHTPDSSRFWMADSYQERFAAGEEPEGLDKEFLRLWITGRCDPYTEAIPAIPDETLLNFSQRYVSLFERLTGSSFERPEPSVSVRGRVLESLKREFPEYFSEHKSMGIV